MKIIDYRPSYRLGLRQRGEQLRKEMDTMTVTIKMIEPKEKEYCNTGKCPPIKQGRGCYEESFDYGSRRWQVKGDCIDCFSRDRDMYERIKNNER